jgi:hypothetical protein
MHGIESIVAMNSHASNRVTETPLACPVDMEYWEARRAAHQNYELGLYTYEQFIEELAEISNIYM